MQSHTDGCCMTVADSVLNCQ